MNQLLKNEGVRHFGKFIIVGVTNTAIDFAVYNALMYATHISEGPYVNVFTSISFLVALINSYYLNKYWTFKDKNRTEDPKQFIKFFSVSFVGLLLNNTIIFYFVSIMHPAFGLSSVLWANFAKVLATCIVLFWNFIGFKFFVFKK